MELYDMTTETCEYYAKCSNCFKSTIKDPEAMTCEICHVPFENGEQIICGFPSQDAEDRIHCHSKCREKSRAAMKKED